MNKKQVTLTNEVNELIGQYRELVKVLPTQIYKALEAALKAHTASEVLVLPVTIDEYDDVAIASESGTGFEEISTLGICKATADPEEEGMVMFRLGIINGKLMFHGGTYDVWMSAIGGENIDEDWLPISEFKNFDGLLKIAEFLLNKETAWQYTKTHPDMLFSALAEAIKAKEVEDESNYEEFNDEEDTIAEETIVEEEPVLNTPDPTVGEEVVSFFFKDKKTYESLDFFGLDTSKVVNGENMFKGFDNLKNVDLSSLNLSNTRTLHGAFSYDESLETVEMSRVDTSMVGDWGFIFRGCKNLRNVNLRGLNTSRITEWRCMFDDCSAIEEIDLSGLDVSRATQMSYMFSGCTSLRKLNLSGWNMLIFPFTKDMFDNCKNLEEVNLSGCDELTITQIKNTISESAESGRCKDLSEIHIITQ